MKTTLETARPNACNLCRLDKTLSWTSDQLVQWKPQPETSLHAGAQRRGPARAWPGAGHAAAIPRPPPHG